MIGQSWANHGKLLRHVCYVWVIFIVNIIWKQTTQSSVELFCFILVGFVASRLHSGKGRKDLIVTLFGLGGRDYDSQNQYYLFLDTPDIRQQFTNKYNFS